MNTSKKEYMDQLFRQILDYLIDKVNSEESKKKIQQKLLDPMIDYIGRRLYPYVLIVSFCFVILILILFFMIWNK